MSPNPSPAVSQYATPIRTGSASTDVFTSNHHYRDPILERAAREMQHHFQELPVQKLLDMLPDAPGMPHVVHEPFMKVSRIKKEVDTYNPFVRLLRCFLRRFVSF
jgi:hypothetical protein